MYYKGLGVPQDYAEALKQFQLAADQGFSIAQDNLARMYYLGHGVKQDVVEAYMWVTLAATGLPALHERDGLADNRSVVAKKISPGQIAEAQRLAQEWLAAH